MGACRAKPRILPFAVAALLTCIAPCWATHLNHVSPVDVDKSHEGGNWLTNWFDDLDNDGTWDLVVDNPALSEPYADVAQGGWANPVQLRDMSCWLGVAANMLDAGGYGDGGSIYQTLLDHYGWRQPGSPDTALAYYIAIHGVGVSVYTQIYTYWNNNGSIGAVPVRDFISTKLRTTEYGSES